MSKLPPFTPEGEKIRERHLLKIETVAYATGMLNAFRRESVIIEETLEKLATRLEKAGCLPYSNKYEFLHKAIANARVTAKGLSLELNCAIAEAEKEQEGGA